MLITFPFQVEESTYDAEMLPSTLESSVYAANEVAARLRVDTRTGLSWSEANYRTKIVGHNELNAKEEDPTWKKYAQQFQNPLILLLLGEKLFFYFLRVNAELDLRSVQDGNVEFCRNYFYKRNLYHYTPRV